MASWQEIETRQISGTGSIRIPAGEDNQYRAFRLYLQIIRQPRNRYRNFKYPDAREYYGKALFYKDNYVCEEREVNFAAEKWEIVPDITSQNLIAIKCAYDGTLQSFVNLAAALALPYISVTDLIEDYTYLEPQYDRIVFKMFDRSALRIRLEGLKNDTCEPIKDKQQPPNNPPPPDRNPPNNDSPVLVTPPYDDDAADGFFDPFPGDEEDSQFPFGEECQEFDIDLLITPFVGEQIPLTVRLFGVIEGVGVGGEGAFIYVLAQGGRDSVDPIAPTCLEEVVQCAVFGSTEPSYSNVELLDYREV